MPSVWKDCWRAISLQLGLATVFFILLFLDICHMMPVDEAHETPWLPLGSSQPSTEIINLDGAEHSAGNAPPPPTLLESSQQISLTTNSCQGNRDSRTRVKPKEEKKNEEDRVRKGAKILAASMNFFLAGN